jgi:hypothetical protein
MLAVTGVINQKIETNRKTHSDILLTIFGTMQMTEREKE